MKLNNSESVQNRLFIALSAPAVVWFGVFFLYPLVDLFVTSFHRWRGIIHPREFIALSNYIELLRDKEFFKVFLNSLIRILINYGVMMPVAIILGWLLSLKGTGTKILRTVFFFPFLLSAIATAIIWWIILLPDGVLNNILSILGLGNLRRAWISDVDTAFLATVAPMVWTAIGFYAVLFYTALHDIPREIYEAAELEGASSLICFTKITLPLAIPFMGIYFIWELIGAFNNFGSIVVLTKGGPGNASNILGYYAFEQAFVFRNLGYSATISVVGFVLCIFLALVIQRLVTRDYQY